MNFMLAKTGNSVKLLITRLWTGLNGIYFGQMNVWWRKTMLIAIINLQRMVSCLRSVPYSHRVILWSMRDACISDSSASSVLNSQKGL